MTNITAETTAKMAQELTVLAVPRGPPPRLCLLTPALEVPIGEGEAAEKPHPHWRFADGLGGTVPTPQPIPTLMTAPALCVCPVPTTALSASIHHSLDPHSTDSCLLHSIDEETEAMGGSTTYLPGTAKHQRAMPLRGAPFFLFVKGWLS